MARTALIFTLLSLCTWLVSAAEATGPGEPFRLCPACWCILLVVGIIVVFALGWLIGRQRRP